ncbi:MAG: helix-turn-helix transcriptional regulator [Alcaligenaceae bacterium]|nr:helix-turn-helix transcriptional regulator [Alcaligenaceae bacterium]
MNTSHTILEANGKPAFVVLPYDEYLELTGGQKPAGRIPADDTTPHEVMCLCVKNDWSMIRAWREHLGLTQAEMATRLEIRQPSYAAMEAPDAKPKKTTRERIATAMGLSLEQLDS